MGWTGRIVRQTENRRLLIYVTVVNKKEVLEGIDNSITFGSKRRERGKR